MVNKRKGVIYGVIKGVKYMLFCIVICSFNPEDCPTSIKVFLSPASFNSNYKEQEKRCILKENIELIQQVKYKISILLVSDDKPDIKSRISESTNTHQVTYITSSSAIK